MKRYEAIRTICSFLPSNAVVVTANGFIGRELCAIDDREGNFYMLGSMGLASSIGLGVAISRPSIPVVILDGDGNLLMNLATLPLIGKRRPDNLYHFVLDNACYDSTGGQPTLSEHIDLDKIALASGYPATDRLERAVDLELLADGYFEQPGPRFCLVKVEAGSMDDCPRVKYSPKEISERVARSVANVLIPSA